MKTPLFDQHVELGAKMIPFAGWEMPLQYRRGIAHEVEAVRKRAGKFDVSHMGRISIQGEDTLSFLDFLSVNRILGKAPGASVYTVFCNEAGQAVDDLLVYIVDSSHAFIVCNAANREVDLEHLKNHVSNYRVKIHPHFEEGILSLQGPLSSELFSEAALLPKMHFMQKGALIVSRTGYTGEDGFEFYGPTDEIKKLWEALPAEPCGLGSRDVLRLEMGYALYGHELSKEIGPLESVAAWAVKLDHEFLGKSALKKSRKPIALVGTSNIPAREGYPIFHQEKQIGKITSGTFSPTLQKPIALGIVDDTYPSVDVLIRGKHYSFLATTLPFVKLNSGKR